MKSIQPETKDKKLVELIVETLEDFERVSKLNLSSEAARSIIARCIVDKIEKKYDYNIKYFYS